MSSFKTKGIVLKSINFGESDKILTILTERFGKVKAIAKGIKKIKSHLAGSLEPFMLVDLQLHEGKTFYIVTGAVIDQDFPRLHSNLNKVAKAFFLGELVDQFLKERENPLEIFELFSDSLSEIEEDIPGPLIQAFQIKIIAVSGFMPDVYNCLHCKEKITSGDNYWDGNEGGVICDGCNQKFQHGQKKISDQAIKLIRFIEKNNSKEIARLKISDEIEFEVDNILDRYIQNILEKELKSQRFLKML